MLKKLLSLTALLLSGIGLQAQTPPANKVFTGEHGAQTTIIYSVTPGYVQFLSSDSRYFSGIYGGTAGFAYDMEKDTALLYEYTLPGFISTDHYAGQDDPGETVVNAFVYYNGTKSPLEKVLSSGKISYDDVFISAVQGNGEKVVTMVYEQYSKPSGAQGFVNVAAIHDGKTGKFLHKLPLVWPIPASGEALGFGARGDCISGDGTVVGGHSTNPFVKNKWSLAFWDCSDPANIRAFGIEDDGFDFGSFYGASYDGSILVGGSESNSQGIIVHYDKANNTFTYETLNPLPGWDYLELTGVADNGMCIGYCGMALDPGTREPIVYTELTGVVPMGEFLYEYYDVDLQGLNLYTPMVISRDGNTMVGFFYDENNYGYATPYYHKLGTERILPRARKISARSFRELAEVQIKWQQPLVSENVLKGYNIYRDDETTPLNPSLLSATTYTDKEAAVGRHTYYIEAVYENAPAKKAASNTVQVVAQGECFPVQSIGHQLAYNRYATVYWGLPSSEVVALSRNDHALPTKEAKGKFNVAADALPQRTEQAVQPAAPQAKSYTSTTLDYIANVDMKSYSGYAAIKIGNLYYTSSHLGGGIQVLDQFNEVLEVIAPKGLGAVLSMVYDKDANYLYCGTNNAIMALDLDDPTEIQENFPVPARFLAYVPELDGGKGGFVAGTAHSCNTYTKTGKLIEANILDFKSPIYACGAAYHNGRLYVSSASGKYYNEIYVFDFEKREQIGAPIQVVEDPALYNLLSFDGQLPALDGVTQAGGLSVCTLEDGTTALGAVFQCAYMTSRLMLLEIESDASVKGYDLYRSVNGGEYQKINTAPLATRRYAEMLTEAGQYAYYVKVLPQVSGAPESTASPIDTVTIKQPSACAKPTFSVSESNRWAVLEWMPQECDNILIGFNLLRNGEEICRFWEKDMRLDYVDQVAETGTYTYTIEALYDDGCVGAETQKITLTGQGKALAPFGLSLDAQAKDAAKTAYDVTAKWETPMFEEPLALRYCNAVMLNAVTFDNYNECWAAIGWDQANLGLYKDLYLVGMEYLIGAVPTTFEGFVILNDEMVYTQPIRRPIAREWQTVMFDRSFPMDQPHEVAVGYHTTFTAESAGVLTVDESVSKSGYSDLITLDGQQWSTLKAGGKKGSWCIAGLVVHKRDLEAAKKADGSIDHKKLQGSIIRMAQNQPLNAEVVTLPTTFTAKPSAKEGLTLTGFNLYRKAADAAEGTEKKLNSELLTTFEWLDPSLPTAEYQYIIGAVYADGQEIKTEEYIDLTTVTNEGLTGTLSLDLYPNPATDVVNVTGEYESLRIFDLSGRLLRTCQAAAQISLDGLQPGTYFFHFTDADARKAVYKVVVR